MFFFKECFVLETVVMVILFDLSVMLHDGEESSKYNMESVVLLMMAVCLAPTIHTHSQFIDSKSILYLNIAEKTK